MINIISLGAGVQSTAMAMMAEHGIIKPYPDHAIFADTGAEPDHVYKQMEWVKERVGFPVHIVQKDEGILSNVLYSAKSGGRYIGPPLFADSGKKGGGQLRRFCTGEFKIVPIEKKVRELAGLKPGQRSKEVLVNQWIGISKDESHRAKPAKLSWIKNRHPLLEIGFYRLSCLEWMQEQGYPLPKSSSCYFCPYHTDEMWRDMRENDPKSWSAAIEVDKTVRKGVKGTEKYLYVHRSMKPLDEADIDTDRGKQKDAFGDECEGMCGL